MENHHKSFMKCETAQKWPRGFFVQTEDLGVYEMGKKIGGNTSSYTMPASNLGIANLDTVANLQFHNP